MKINKGRKGLKKTAVITGATSGIGLETAKALLQNGFEVICIYRSQEKMVVAKQVCKDGYFIKGDMSYKKSLQSIATQVETYLGDRGLDVLVNNAGTFFSKFSLSEDGIEMQMAVNAFAPMALSLLLYDRLLRVNGKIVNVTSNSHYCTCLRWRDLQLQKHYNQLKAYKQTKLLSVLLSKAFNEKSKNVKMVMADPGLVNTDIGYKNTKGISKFVWNLRKKGGQTPLQGAQTSIYLACKSQTNHFYYKNCIPKKASKYAYNDTVVKRAFDYFQSVYKMTMMEYIEKL
jgi:NAD(P)-dependent dehydrogenase (short-subunit alcohol dehydrogenase family)